MVFALAWIIRFTAGDLQVVLEYDSDYAANSLRRFVAPRCNIALIVKGRTICDMVSHRITWRKVVSHTGLLLNDRADTLANCGAYNICRGMTQLAATLAFS